MVLVIMFRITICDKIQENEQILQAQFRLIEGCLFASMGRIIPHSPDKIKPLPKVFVNNIPEFLRMHQTAQIILIRPDQRLIDRIHPLNGKFHCPAAVDNTRLRVNMYDSLRRYGDIREGLELGL